MHNKMLWCHHDLVFNVVVDKLLGNEVGTIEQ
jgi:hypothetical protein